MVSVVAGRRHNIDSRATWSYGGVQRVRILRVTLIEKDRLPEYPECVALSDNSLTICQAFAYARVGPRHLE